MVKIAKSMKSPIARSDALPKNLTLEHHLLALKLRSIKLLIIP
jgi:hypothetical protein